MVGVFSNFDVDRNVTKDMYLFNIMPLMGATLYSAYLLEQLLELR